MSPISMSLFLLERHLLLVHQLNVRLQRRTTNTVYSVHYIALQHLHSNRRGKASKQLTMALPKNPVLRELPHHVSEVTSLNIRQLAMSDVEVAVQKCEWTTR